MNQSLKEQMITNVRKGDDVIKGIKDDQLIIVTNYVSRAFGLTEKTKFLLNDNKVQLHHISFSDGAKKINLHYQKLNHNDVATGVVFTALLHDNLKIQLI